jgi:adenosine/AMP kinase
MIAHIYLFTFSGPFSQASRLDRMALRRNHLTAMEIKLTAIQIEKPEAVNFILGQTHFIKSVEDIHEALVGAVPGIKFGLAFCEASGKCLVRWTGTDPAMIELARRNALAIGAGHSFILFLGEGFYPVNVLNAVKMVSEVCRVFCATANPSARWRNHPGPRHCGRRGRSAAQGLRSRS